MKLASYNLRAIADALDQLAQLKSTKVNQVVVNGITCKLERYEDQREGATYYLVEVIQ
jgi:hypothetical protein